MEKQWWKMVVRKLERLHKYLARCGVASRRKAEALIQEGVVRVNGRIIVEMGFKVNPAEDSIELWGQKIKPETEKIYLLLNKPARVVTTLSDPQGRKKVTDLLKGIKGRVYPVGRLDYHSEGLLLLTNDGELTNRLIHPRYAIAKMYVVEVRGHVAQQKLKELREGIALHDGLTLPAKVKLRQYLGETTILEITIREGRNRQIRRMCQKVGHPVITLRRQKFGPLQLGNLGVGEYRRLKAKEIASLRKMCALV